MLLGLLKPKPQMQRVRNRVSDFRRPLVNYIAPPEFAWEAMRRPGLRFGEFLREGVKDVFQVDGRMVRTLGTLFRRPGAIDSLRQDARASAAVPGMMTR